MKTHLLASLMCIFSISTIQLQKNRDRKSPQKRSIERNCVLIKKENARSTNLALLKKDSGKIEDVNYLDETDNILEGNGYNIDVYALKQLNNSHIALAGIFTIQDESGIPKTFTSIIVNIETVDFQDFNGHFPDNDLVFSDTDNNAYYKWNNAVYQLQISAH